MRVIECNECGEAISAADDDALARKLSAHLESEHELETDDEEIAELVADEAYEATDS